MARLDRKVLLVLFALMGIGLVQVYSSSFVFAIESRGDALYFFKRQLVFSVVAAAALLTTAHLPFRWFEKAGWIIWPVAALGVVATMIPGLGARAGGAARWLALPGGGVFEPSELLKIALSLLLATFFSQRFAIFGRYQRLVFLALFAVPLYLVLRQPDFGTFFICTVVFVGVHFAFGLNWRYIVGAVAVSLPAFYLLVMKVPYRRARIMAFLDPWADPSQKGFQVIQSMLSFQGGGLTGVGLGQGQGKLFFLPEAHTDFTLAVLGEETGFIGVAVVFSLYGYLVFRGLQLATRAENTFAKVLALGLSLTFGLSVFINAGVVMGMLPTKGLTLPFLSSGGSSLVMTCFLFGLILNIERTERLGVSVAKQAQKYAHRKNLDARMQMGQTYRRQ